MNYTVTISDEVSNSIQYLLDNKSSSNNIMMPHYTAGKTTVEEVLQNIVEAQSAMYIGIANQFKEKEWIDTLKAEPVLLTSVTSKITEIKQAKILAEEAKRIEEPKIIVPDAPPEEVPQGI
jgi:hypothetical protein